MSEADGLIHGYVLDGKGGGQSLSWEAINKWKPEDGLLWLHLDYANPVASKWIEEESGIEPLASEILLGETTRPRNVVHHEGMLLVLRGVNMNPGASPDDMVSIRIWLEADRIVTTRHRRILSVEELVSDLGMGKGPESPGDFLVHLAWRMANRIADVVEEINDAVDDLEDQVLLAESYALRPALSSIRRQSISLRRYLAPQKEVMLRLYNEKFPLFTDMDRLHLREIADRTTRFVEDLDEVRDRAAVTHEELASRLAEQLDKRMYILSIVAAIFLPLGFATGLLGINVGGIPGANFKWAFAIVCVGLLGIGIGLYFGFKKRKWI